MTMMMMMTLCPVPTLSPVRACPPPTRRFASARIAGRGQRENQGRQAFRRCVNKGAKCGLQGGVVMSKGGHGRVLLPWLGLTISIFHNVGRCRGMKVDHAVRPRHRTTCTAAPIAGPPVVVMPTRAARHVSSSGHHAVSPKMHAALREKARGLRSNITSTPCTTLPHPQQPPQAKTLLCVKPSLYCTVSNCQKTPEAPAETYLRWDSFRVDFLVKTNTYNTSANGGSPVQSQPPPSPPSPAPNLTVLAFFTNSLRHGVVSPLATSAPFARSTLSISTTSNASPRSRRYQPALIFPVPVGGAAEGDEGVGAMPIPPAAAAAAL